MFKSKPTSLLTTLLFILTLLLLPQTNTPTAAQSSSNLIPIIYQNNVWLADPDNLTLRQLTTDATDNVLYTHPFLSPTGRYLAFEKRVGPFEYYQGATTYNIYDLQTNTLTYHGSFPTQYSFPDIYGEQRTESYNILGWQYNTDTLLIAKEINNCNQDFAQPRTLEILTSPPPYNALTLQTTQITNAPAIEALNLTNSPQNWVDVRDNCCACGPSISHLNYLAPDGQSLTFEGSSLQTSAVIPSPDNNHIAFASSSGYDVYYYENLTELGTSTLNISNIYTISPISIHTLTNYHITDNSITWAPNSQYLAFITFNINQDFDNIEQFAGIVPISGANPIILNTPSVKSIHWSPDSTKLLLLTQQDGIIIYDLNTHISHAFQEYGNPISLIDSAACADILPSRLLNITQARVLADPPLANNLRALPNKNAQLIGQIAPGATFTLIDGPICTDGYRYWYVKDDATNLYGWTAEAYLNEYYVEPIQ